MTVGGVCTSLGLGSMQIITGAERLGWLDTEGMSDEDLTNKQVLVIWVITAIATVSVVSGLSVGIKLLSQIGFGLGMLLLFLCLVMEKTNYIFNVTVQTIGYFFQYCILLVPFWTVRLGWLHQRLGCNSNCF
jgi:choline-glycine betaine transporter